MVKKVLVVDDEQDILDLIAFQLNAAGFETKVALNGAEALLIAKVFAPNLIILDLNMPMLDGVQTCLQLRADSRHHDCALMMLTAMGDEANEVKALEAGADDFVRKPITPALLMSRVKNLLKRFGAEAASPKLNFGDLVIIPQEHVVVYQGVKLQLARKEFQLLHLLASNPGKVYDRAQLLQDIWGSDVIVGDRTVDVHVRKIRQKLDDKFIYTIKGLGYKFEA
jgi:two-component system, OmpR family, alkaline phosphatase synthesis response regulator PhoP